MCLSDIFQMIRLRAWGGCIFSPRKNNPVQSKPSTVSEITSCDGKKAHDCSKVDQLSTLHIILIKKIQHEREIGACCTPLFCQLLYKHKFSSQEYYQSHFKTLLHQRNTIKANIT